MRGKKYRDFISAGKGRPGPWDKLSNQVFLGDIAFVSDMQQKTERDWDLSEVPRSQRHKKAKSLDHCKRLSADRNKAINAAYASRGYTMKKIGKYIVLHYSRVSRTVKLTAKSKT